MQQNIFYENSISLDLLNNYNIGLIGYGNQGRAQALNMKDNGLSLTIGARACGSAYSQALKDGFEVVSIEQVSQKCDLLIILLPDEIIKQVYEKSVEPNCNEPKSFVFAHGFVLREKLIDLKNQKDVVLVAPTGPGKYLRDYYLSNKSLPALIGVYQDKTNQALQLAKSVGRAIGCAKAGLVETSVEEETIVDLFCEQAVLCGGLPGLVKESFNTLVDRGYSPILAYISCLKEVKLIADLMFYNGIDSMREAISTTAKYGSFEAQNKLINNHFKLKLNQLLSSIEDQSFSKRYLESLESDLNDLKLWVKEEKNTKIIRAAQEIKERLNF